MKKLKKYQQEGRDFLTNNGTLIPYHSILGDDMGLGKTAQAIKAAEKVGAKRLLVICPSSVKVNWMRELMEWSGYSDIFIAGRRGKISAKNCVIPKDCDCVIINYDMCIMKRVKNQLLSMRFDVGIMDECHYLMNKTSGRTKAVLARNGIIWSCKHKWGLSGTLMKNRNRDMFPILLALFPHCLGRYSDYKAFADRFCGGRMGMFGYEDTGSTNTEELGKMIAPIMMRRTKPEVLSELPEILEQNIYLEKTPEIERALMIENELTDEQIEGMLNFEQMGLTATYRKDLAMAKLPQAINIIKDTLGSVEKLVVFAYHRDFIDALVDKLNDYGVEVVKGGIGYEEKQRRVDNFVNDKNIRIFIGQIEAAGTGIDGLQLVCSNMIFAEIDWVPGTLDQAGARCHRMGQKNQVHIQYLIVPDSLEEAMLRTLKHKKHNIKSVMGQIERVVEQQEEKEKHMTLESTLERIAIALENLNNGTTLRVDNSQVGECKAIEPEEKPKAKRKSRAKAEVTTEEQQVTATVAEVVETAVESVEVAQPAQPTAQPKATLGEVVNAVKLAAGQLMSKIGQGPATVFVNEITSQIVGKEGARVSDCKLDQAEAVLDAVQAKLQELNSVGGI
jgi:SWI/SNF-related matrix-associated actin-dependent regulator 1 of chromatin subfamily A